MTDTVTGIPGDSTYNFSVTNNLGGSNDIYFFGVLLETSTITGYPLGWAPKNPFWSNAPYGGSDTVYNNSWYSESGPYVEPGQTLSGFEVEFTSAAQTNIQWFAYALGGVYTGGGNFNGNINPGFEGAIGEIFAIPEPSTWALMLLGFAGMGYVGYRRARMQSTARMAA